MSKFATRTLCATALAVALALAGCGGNDDSTMTGVTTTGADTTKQSGDTGRRTTTSPQGADARQAEGEGQKNRSDGDSTATVPFAEPTGPAPTSSGSLPNEGTKRPAPGVPINKNTDSSVQTFGVEAPSGDRVEAARIFQAFLNARAEGRWQLACSYLSDAIKRQMEALAGQSGGGASSDCVQVMKAFGAGVPAEQLRIAADIRVISMRVDGDTAIVIYRDGRGTPSTVPMNREGGAWKVSAAAGSVLFLGV